MRLDVTTSEAARLLSLSVSTVQAMVRSGELAAWRTTGGHRRIALESVEVWRKARGERLVTMRRAPTQARGGGMLTVLLVGCEPDAFADDERALNGPGAVIQYHRARDSCDAFLLAERVRPDVLIARDVLEPIDGLELVRRLRRHREFDHMLAVLLLEDGVPAFERGNHRPVGTLLVEGAFAAERLEGLINAQLLRR